MMKFKKKLDSFSSTVQAVLHNDENVVLTTNPALVSQFCQHFEQLWAANNHRDSGGGSSGDTGKRIVAKY